MCESLWPQGSLEEADGCVQGIHLSFNMTHRRGAAETCQWVIAKGSLGAMTAQRRESREGDQFRGHTES